MVNLAIGSCLGPIWALLVIVGVATNTSQLRDVGYAVATLDVLALVRQLFLIRTFRHIAEQALGIQVRWRKFPASEEKYLAWCASRGIQPYQLDDRHNA